MQPIFKKLAVLSNRTLLLIPVFLAIISGVLSLMMNFLSTASDISIWAASWLQNFSTEMIGAIATYLLFESIIGQREKQKQVEERRRLDQLNMTMLLRQARTREEMLTILDEMIRSDLLRGAFLSGLDLESVNLNSVDLEGARLGVEFPPKSGVAEKAIH